MNECKIYQAPIVALTGENWIGELGDIRVRGFSEEEARSKLAARIAELDRQLRSIVAGPASPGIARWMRRQDGSLAE